MPSIVMASFFIYSQWEIVPKNLQNKSSLVPGGNSVNRTLNRTEEYARLWSDIRQGYLKNRRLFIIPILVTIRIVSNGYSYESCGIWQ